MKVFEFVLLIAQLKFSRQCLRVFEKTKWNRTQVSDSMKTLRIYIEPINRFGFWCVGLGLEFHPSLRFFRNPHYFPQRFFCLTFFSTLRLGLLVLVAPSSYLEQPTGIKAKGFTFEKISGHTQGLREKFNQGIRR